MKKKFKLLSLVVLVAVFLIASIPAFAQDANLEWEDLYMEPISMSRASVQEMIGQEALQITHIVPHFFTTIHTGAPGGIDEFVRAVRAGTGLADMLETEPWQYWARNGADSVALRREGRSLFVGMISMDDSGDMFSLSDSARYELAEMRVVPNRDTVTKLVTIEGFATGFLVLGDSGEYFVVTSTGILTSDLLELDGIYSILEIAEIMERNVESLTMKSPMVELLMTGGFPIEN